MTDHQQLQGHHPEHCCGLWQRHAPQGLHTEHVRMAVAKRFERWWHMLTLYIPCLCRLRLRMSPSARPSLSMQAQAPLSAP